MSYFRRLLFSFLLTLALAGRALALCGDVSGGEGITATDALEVLRTAVGSPGHIACPCDDCVGATVSLAPRHCADVDGDSEISASDALTILKRAVGEDVPVSCSCEPCGGTAATTTTTPTPTTTTLRPCLDEAAALDGRTFIRKTRCITSLSSCAQTQVTDTIELRHVGADQYEVRSVPDDELLSTGTLSCRKLTLSRLETWTFETDDSFAGARFPCKIVGTESPTTPPDIPPLRCRVAF